MYTIKSHFLFCQSVRAVPMQLQYIAALRHCDTGNMDYITFSAFNIVNKTIYTFRIKIIYIYIYIYKLFKI